MLSRFLSLSVNGGSSDTGAWQRPRRLFRMPSHFDARVPSLSIAGEKSVGHALRFRERNSRNDAWWQARWLNPAETNQTWETLSRRPSWRPPFRCAQSGSVCIS